MAPPLNALIALSIVCQIIALTSSDAYLSGWEEDEFRNWYLPRIRPVSDWPLVGHVLAFDREKIDFAWLWCCEAQQLHFDP
jgi:hypothetical protein